MKKKLNTDSVMNELKGGSGFFPSQPTSQEATPPVQQSTNQSTEQSTNELVGRPTSKSIKQSTNQAVSSPTDADQTTILGRPKAFYITQKQDEELDIAAKNLGKYLEGKLSQKVDRSTVIRLLLEEADLTNKETTKRLASRLVSRLISQLTS